jgi:hypothetical protein
VKALSSNPTTAKQTNKKLSWWELNNTHQVTWCLHCRTQFEYRSYYGNIHIFPIHLIYMRLCCCNWFWFYHWQYFHMLHFNPIFNINLVMFIAS